MDNMKQKRIMAKLRVLQCSMELEDFAEFIEDIIEDIDNEVE